MNIKKSILILILIFVYLFIFCKVNQGELPVVNTEIQKTKDTEFVMGDYLYHLQKMAVEEKPLLYLKKFL